MQSRSFQDQELLRQVLGVVLDHLSPLLGPSDYRLVGTAASLLHGVPLTAGDIDFLMQERRCVEAFGAALASFRCETRPGFLAEARQYFARYEIDRTYVEASTVEWETDSDFIEVLGRGPWIHFTQIAVGPHAVPTVRLELRLATELHRNRPERWRPMLAWMRTNGHDGSLLRRAMEARRLPPACQDHVLQELSASRNDGEETHR